MIENYKIAASYGLTILTLIIKECLMGLSQCGYIPLKNNRKLALFVKKIFNKITFGINTIMLISFHNLAMAQVHWQCCSYIYKGRRENHEERDYHQCNSE